MEGIMSFCVILNVSTSVLGPLTFSDDDLCTSGLQAHDHHQLSLIILVSN